MQKIYFGAGCFWGVEEAFRTHKGVEKTRVGYMGGTTENPTYQDVCTDTTGHVEVVEVVYGEEKVFFEELLSLFWTIHNPTEGDRQGYDIGTQYRSVIFYTNEEQKILAQVSKEGLETLHRFSEPITTAIEKAKVFYEAEEYHQQYILKTGSATCHI